MRDPLKNLIDAVRDYKMSIEQRWAQALSFTLGQSPEETTPEDVDRHLRGNLGYDTFLAYKIVKAQAESYERTLKEEEANLAKFAELKKLAKQLAELNKNSYCPWRDGTQNQKEWVREREELAKQIEDLLVK